jgi:hypothetical protein
MTDRDLLSRLRKRVKPFSDGETTVFITRDEVLRLVALAEQAEALREALRFYTRGEFKWRTPTSGWQYDKGEIACAALREDQESEGREVRGIVGVEAPPSVRAVEQAERKKSERRGG